MIIDGWLDDEDGWQIYKEPCRRAAVDHLGFSCRPGGYGDEVGVVRGVPVAVLWAADDQYYQSEAMLAAIPGYAADLRRLERVGLREMHDFVAGDPCLLAERADSFAEEVEAGGAAAAEGLGPADWAAATTLAVANEEAGTLRRRRLSELADDHLAVCGDGALRIYE
jgi:hypothetical protein